MRARSATEKRQMLTPKRVEKAMSRGICRTKERETIRIVMATEEATTHGTDPTYAASLPTGAATTIATKTAVMAA